MEKETHILPNGEVVEFFPETHQYFWNGKELPSITQLISKRFGNSYDAVNPEILKSASEYGSIIHDQLSTIIDKKLAGIKEDIQTDYDEVYNYFCYVEPFYGIRPTMTEKVVLLYGADGTPAACGRFDLLAKLNGENALLDFKTTTNMHILSVTNQLNLYLIAAKQSGYIKDISNFKLGAINLVKNEWNFVPIAVLSPDFYLKFLEDVSNKEE